MFAQWGMLFLASFVIELVINRYPWVVATAVPAIGFGLFVLRNLQDLSFDVLEVFGTIALVGVLPSLVGAGLARYIRFWFELKRADQKSTIIQE